MEIDERLTRAFFLSHAPGSETEVDHVELS